MGGQTVDTRDRFAHRQFRVAVTQDEVQPILGVGRVDRQVHRAGLEHPQCGDDQLRRLVQHDRDAVFGADLVRDEPVRDLIGVLVELAVAVVAALVDDGGGFRGAGRLGFDEVDDRGRRGVERRAMGHLAQPFPVGVTHQVQPAERTARSRERAVEQHQVVVDELLGELRLDDLDEVLEFDDDLVGAELDHDAQWKVGQMGPQVGAFATHPGWSEPEPVGAAESEADPRHPLGAVPPVGVELANHAVQPDPLMCERPDGGVPALVQQFGEGHRRLRSQTQGHGVAEIPDDVLGVGGAVEHRGCDQEVVDVAVAVHESAEHGEQHRVGRGARIGGHRAHPRRDVAVEAPCGASGAPTGGHRRTGRSRQLEGLGRVGHHRAPVRHVGVVVHLGRRPGPARREGFTLVGAREVGEEHLPGTVVPGDVVGDQQQHEFRGADAYHGDPKR